ncbi:preprotein translocase subunit SecY, partial [Salmonella enterica subsp. enterica serovar Enteritidis]|nr:preprotein translocase subunit SecY [Salmonella enterica subsp. enterica serovar Enteritidis]
TRQLTLALALIQSIGMCTGLISQNLTLTSGLGFYIPAVTSLVAGSMFLMWLGEQITERGIGNGISMLILAGIIATFPQVVTQSINSVQQGQMNMIALLIFSLLALAVVAGI